MGRYGRDIARRGSYLPSLKKFRGYETGHCSLSDRKRCNGWFWKGLSCDRRNR